MQRAESLEKTDAGRDWGQEEKGTTEDEMAGWHHWLDGCESQWTLGVDVGQGGLVCCNSWSRKESDTTERLIWSDPQIPSSSIPFLNFLILCLIFYLPAFLLAPDSQWTRLTSESIKSWAWDPKPSADVLLSILLPRVFSHSNTANTVIPSPPDRCLHPAQILLQAGLTTLPLPGLPPPVFLS